MIRRILTLAVCLALAGLTGCALTTERIELQYNPQSAVTQMPGAKDVSVNVRVADQRQDKSKVSSKKNGFGIEMAPIIPSEDVAVTVRKAIEQELRARGFQLAATDPLIQIDADLIRFYNDHKVGFFSGDAVADLNMSVLVKSRSGSMLFSKQIAAQGIEPNTMLMTGENAKLALNRALESGLKILFEDRAFLSALVASSASTK